MTWWTTKNLITVFRDIQTSILALVTTKTGASRVVYDKNCSILYSAPAIPMSTLGGIIQNVLVKIFLCWCFANLLLKQNQFISEAVANLFFKFSYCFACRMWKKSVTMFDRASPLNSSPFINYSYIILFLLETKLYWCFLVRRRGRQVIVQFCQEVALRLPRCLHEVARGMWKKQWNVNPRMKSSWQSSFADTWGLH